ncbi:MAG: ATP-binding protein [Actinomycetes bacterium]
MAVGTTHRADEVKVSIVRDPALVRTVRLIAAAVARRTGLDEEFVEEVRLAVGEACALLVGEEGEPSPDAYDPVAIAISLDERFRVEVTSNAPVVVADPPFGELDGVEPWALMRALIEDFNVVQNGTTTRVSMSWPL